MNQAQVDELILQQMILSITTDKRFNVNVLKKYREGD